VCAIDDHPVEVTIDRVTVEIGHAGLATQKRFKALNAGKEKYAG
jgi:hypothetical protein